MSRELVHSKISVHHCHRLQTGSYNSLQSYVTGAEGLLCAAKSPVPLACHPTVGPDADPSFGLPSRVGLCMLQLRYQWQLIPNIIAIDLPMIGECKQGNCRF